MLILSRVEGESIILIADEPIHRGACVELRVTRVDHGTVRIGVKAPQEIAIFREELLRKMQKNGER